MTRTRRKCLPLAALAVATAISPGVAAAADGPRAEVQINLCGDSAQITDALALARRGRPTTVWLFDTPALDLARAGQRLRLRQGDGTAELTLKVAGQHCSRLDPAALAPGGKCETDVHGKSADEVLSLTRRLSRAQVDALVAPPATGGSRLAAALQGVLDARQRAMLGDAVPLDSLLRLGPATIQGYRAPGQRFDVEFWTMPDGARFAEMSQKGPLATAPALQAELLERLASVGVEACADQESRAQAKLESLVRSAGPQPR